MNYKALAAATIFVAAATLAPFALAEAYYPYTYYTGTSYMAGPGAYMGPGGFTGYGGFSTGPTGIYSSGYGGYGGYGYGNQLNCWVNCYGQDNYGYPMYGVNPGYGYMPVSYNYNYSPYIYPTVNVGGGMYW